MLKIKNPKFLISAPDLLHCPDSPLPEFALLGRSNVGKSSFINRLTNNAKLAKTSNTPGKTRLINLFEISESFIIADLPGYGYAKVSKTEQNRWQKSLEVYLLKRKNLKSSILFIDARHDIQKNDLQMLEWLQLNNVPYFAIMTKCDYISRNETFNKINSLSKILSCDVLAFSSKNDFYKNKVISYFERLI